MEALRCKHCGDTRWSFMGFGGRTDAECEICGGEMVPERRLPNHAAPLHLLAERRGSKPVGSAAPARPPAGTRRD